MNDQALQTSEQSAVRDLSALVDLGTQLQHLGYQFVTSTPATTALVNARPGNEQAHDLQGVFGWSRPFEATLLAPAML
jgi:hypothetical protein